MFTLLTILIVLVSVLLTVLVLVQNSKGGGLAAGFSSSNQYMGVRKTTDFLETSTWTLVAAVVVMSVMAVYFNKKQATTDTSGAVIKEQAQQARQTAPGVVTPNFGEGQNTQKQAAPATPAK